MMMPIAFAVSIEEPPPIATMRPRACLKCRYAGLNILNSRVGLYFAEHLICDARFVENIGDFLGYAELDEVGVGCDEGLFEASCGDFLGNCLGQRPRRDMKFH